MDINEFLNNPENTYYGHGIGLSTKETIESIFNYGLKCKDNKLFWTSIELGSGTKIDDECKGMLKNWPHKKSEIVIIVSLPKKYLIYPNSHFGTDANKEIAYYYMPNITRELLKKYPQLSHTSFVMPEFVAGYYDSINDNFVSNPKYYEKLSDDEQFALFEQVKLNYFNAISSYVDIEDYKELMSNIPSWDFALTDKEVAKFKRKKEETELLAQISPEILNKQLNLPNGRKISAYQYIQAFVLPYIPTSGFITLNNGTKIPILHFIIECIIFDCQERYNGDFVKYLHENVQMTIDLPKR